VIDPLLAAGATAFMAKPIDLAGLLRLADSILDR
jgi:hypothetical protein